jgi:hypothetical protein
MAFCRQERVNHLSNFPVYSTPRKVRQLVVTYWLRARQVPFSSVRKFDLTSLIASDRPHHRFDRTTLERAPPSLNANFKFNDRTDTGTTSKDKRSLDTVCEKATQTAPNQRATLTRNRSCRPRPKWHAAQLNAPDCINMERKTCISLQVRIQ